MGIVIGGIGGDGGSEIPPDPTTEEQVSFLANGGQVVWESGLTFRVSAAIYFINGVEYSSLEQTITLDAADADDDRIDVIALDVNGDVVKITGTPSTPAGEPSIDPETQLKLIIVSVPEDATEPAIANTNIYLEGAEWTDSTNGAGWTLDSTNNPRTGTKDEEATGVATGAWIQWESPVAVDLTLVSQLVFYIRSKAVWPPNKMLRIRFQNAGILKGNEVSLRDGYWGFDSSITGAYQQVAIPISQFQVPTNTTINQLRMTVFGSGAAIGFYLDDIVLQSGVPGVGEPIPVVPSSSSLGPVAEAGTIRFHSGDNRLYVSDGTVWRPIDTPGWPRLDGADDSEFELANTDPPSGWTWQAQQAGMTSDVNNLSPSQLIVLATTGSGTVGTLYRSATLTTANKLIAAAISGNAGGTPVGNDQTFFGLIIRNSSNGRALALVFRVFANAIYLSVNRYDTAVGSPTEVLVDNYEHPVPVVLGIENDGTNLLFWWAPRFASSQGSMQLIYTEALATYLTAAGGAADQYGFYIRQIQNVTNAPTKMAVDWVRVYAA